MEEENIQEKLLPQKIRELIKDLRTEYVDEGKESMDAAKLKQLLADDVYIADMIADWIEDKEEADRSTNPHSNDFKGKEQQVLELLAKSEEISLEDLSKILGRQPSQTETVGSVKLKKVYLAQRYTRVK